MILLAECAKCLCENCQCGTGIGDGIALAALIVSVSAVICSIIWKS